VGLPPPRAGPPQTPAEFAIRTACKPQNPPGFTTRTACKPRKALGAPAKFAGDIE